MLPPFGFLVENPVSLTRVLPARDVVSDAAQFRNELRGLGAIGQMLHDCIEEVKIILGLTPAPLFSGVLVDRGQVAQRQFAVGD